jgi:hypothetical protein
VAAVVTRRLYDEVEVAGILEEREGAEEGEKEYLVQFKVGIALGNMWQGVGGGGQYLGAG